MEEGDSVQSHALGFFLSFHGTAFVYYYNNRYK